MSDIASGIPAPADRRAAPLIILAVAQVAAMALWFSASASVPALLAQGVLGAGQASLFTSAVQFGFVVGTLASAVLGLADRVDPRRFFALSAMVAAIANAGILLFEPASPAVIWLRFATGVCMAGIYPIGMKLASTWSRGDMGLLIGLLVGALTLGNAAPHLFNAVGGIDWRFTILGASATAMLSAVLIGFFRIGPNVGRSPRFDPRLALRVLTVPSLRLANFGYLGHMWELFAMWAWIGLFLDASFRAAGVASAGTMAALGTFATIAVGGLGSVVAGLAADRVGRTTVTIASLAVSGACALGIGFLFGASPALVMGVCLVWGFAVIADSAQFSAAVAELSDPSTVGTMLTMQTCLGFLLTLVTIHLTAGLVDAVGWAYAFPVLALGPVVGIVAMVRLRARPEAVRMAGGRR